MQIFLVDPTHHLFQTLKIWFLSFLHNFSFVKNALKDSDMIFNGKHSRITTLILGIFLIMFPNQYLQVSNSPGVKIRLTQKSIDHMVSVFNRSLPDLLPLVKIPDMQQNQIRISQIKITSYKSDSLKVKLKPAKQVSILLKNAVISMAGNFDSKMGLAKGQGSFVATVIGADVTQNLELGTKAGVAQITARECQTRVRNLDMNIQTSQAGLRNTFNAYKSTAINLVKPMIEKEVCLRSCCLKRFENYLNSLIFT